MLYVKKKAKSENTYNKNCVQKYTFNKKRSEESSRNVCSVYLEDSLGKEKLYLRGKKKNDVWDYYSSNYSTLLDHKRQTICKYLHFYEKNKKQNKHSRCLNMFKL